MIEARGITKRYGDTLAVDNVSFSVQRGEIVGFLGPNGAGKSTTMKVLTCYLAPTEGTAEIDGHDILEDPLAARAAIGYLPENTPLYTDMGVLDFLAYMARLQGVAADRVASRVDEVVRLCDVSPMAHKDIGELSKGYRQRVGLAQALLHDPAVLILDEPTSGLDPAQIVEIRALIRRIAEQKAILLSTHILPEAQNTCDRILIINRGKLVGEGTPGELLTKAAQTEEYTVTFEGAPAGSLRSALQNLAGVKSVDEQQAGGNTRYRLTAAPGSELRKEIFAVAVAQNLNLLELNKTATTLEDVFLRLTSSDPVDDIAGTQLAAAAGDGATAAAGSIPTEQSNSEVDSNE